MENAAAKGHKGHRTGILGGTFDPIHLGHLITAENARDAFHLDRILLIPTGCSYFKADQEVTPAGLRYEMTCAAVNGSRHYAVSDMETKRPGNSYTAVTLQQLHDRHPEDELFYIVGADTLILMSLWKNPETIFGLSTILVETRGDVVPPDGLADEINKLRDRFNAHILPLPVRNMEISSTDIRERVRRGQSIHFLVPSGVEAFIREHGLYQNQQTGEKGHEV